MVVVVLVASSALASSAWRAFFLGASSVPAPLVRLRCRFWPFKSPRFCTTLETVVHEFVRLHNGQSVVTEKHTVQWASLANLHAIFFEIQSYIHRFLYLQELVSITFTSGSVGGEGVVIRTP